MSTKIKAYTGDDVVAIRTKLGISQTKFWSPLGVTQSGGSRYETGRNIPATVRRLIAIAYGTEKQSADTIAALRASRDKGVTK